MLSSMKISKFLFNGQCAAILRSIDKLPKHATVLISVPVPRQYSTNTIYGLQRLSNSYSNVFRNFARIASSSYVNNNVLITVPRRCSTTNSSNINLNEEIVEIYRGPLSNQIRIVKLFSLATSAIGLSAQPVLYQKAAEFGSLGITVAIGAFIGFFTFCTPILLHVICKKYVTTLKYNPNTDEYIANTLSFLAGNRKTIFKASDVEVPEVAGMFTTFSVKNKAMFVDARMFSEPDHYAKLMGYDKPVDFKLNEEKD